MAYKYLLKYLKHSLEEHYSQFKYQLHNNSPLKTPFIWAIFTSQLILRLKTSVMKKTVKRAWENDILITVWEE